MISIDAILVIFYEFYLIELFETNWEWDRSDGCLYLAVWLAWLFHALNNHYPHSPDIGTT
jgi:hypothetical protein